MPVTYQNLFAYTLLPPLLRAYLPHTTHIGTTTTIIPLKFFSRAGSFNTKQHYTLTWQFSEISLKTNSNGLFTSYTRLPRTCLFMKHQNMIPSNILHVQIFLTNIAQVTISWINQNSFLNQISHKTYLSKHHKNIAFTNMNLYITFLIQLFTATFTGLAIKWTNSMWFIKPDFFSNCSSHTSQDTNVLTKHNPSTPISFQNVNHILHKTTMYWPDTTLLNIINIKCFR